MTGRSPATTPHAPIRLGIVGLGLAGGVMASTVATHPAFVIGAGVDTDEDVRAQFSLAHRVPTFGSLEAMLASDTVDTVYIATPHRFHREQAVQAAMRGRHVLVEKPMALSLDDCDAMIDAARDGGVVLLVGHTHGFNPALQVMRDEMAGALGPAASVVLLNYTDFLYRPRHPQDLDTTLGGGIIFNQLPHQIEIARALIPSPLRSVRAVTTSLDPARPTAGGCNALLVFENGASATLVYSGYDGFDSDELHGWISEGGHRKAPAHGNSRRALAGLSNDDESRARRALYACGSTTTSARPVHQPHFGLLLVTCANGDMRCNADGVVTYTQAGAREIPVPSTPWRAGRGDVLEVFRQAIAGAPQPRHDGLSGRATLQACLAVLRSARDGREIDVGDCR